MAYPLTANPAGSYNPAYGGIPSVPSPISTAGEAVAGNIGNLGGLYNLAGSVNAFNQQQAPLGLQTNLPGYAGMIGQSSQNIAGHLAGQIPQDVINQITQQAAERGTATGLAGSPNSSAALLAALGKTSIGLQSQGEQELTAAIGRTPQGPLFDPSKFFVTPDQEQAAQAAADLYKSAPIPSAAAAEARRQATAGLGAGGGGTTFAPTAPSPIRATTWGAGGGGPTTGSSLGTGTTYGGITYPEGTSPATAVTNWNNWYAGLNKSGWQSGSDLAGGEVSPAPLDTAYNPVTNTSNLDPFMGMGSFWGGGTGGLGQGPSTPAGLGIDDALAQFYGTQGPGGFGDAGDLFGTLTPEDLAAFG